MQSPNETNAVQLPSTQTKHQFQENISIVTGVRGLGIVYLATLKKLQSIQSFKNKLRLVTNDL